MSRRFRITSAKHDPPPLGPAPVEPMVRALYCWLAEKFPDFSYDSAVNSLRSFENKRAAEFSKGREGTRRDAGGSSPFPPVTLPGPVAECIRQLVKIIGTCSGKEQFWRQLRERMTRLLTDLVAREL